MSLRQVLSSWMPSCHCGFTVASREALSSTSFLRHPALWLTADCTAPAPAIRTKQASMLKNQQFISKFRDRRVDIGFFGGEPLLRSGWIASLLSKTGGGIRSSATTNGYLLTPDLFRKLLPLGLRTYQITLDGLPEDHDRMRILFNGKGTWQRTYDNIKSTSTM